MFPASRVVWSSVILLAAVVPVIPAQQTKPPASSGTEASPARVRAEALLDQALHNLRQMEWLEAAIRKRMTWPGVAFEAAGRCAIARQPGQAVRSLYEVKVNLGPTEALVKVISDGETLWRVEKLGEHHLVFRYPQAELDRVLKENQRDDIDHAQMVEQITGEHGLTAMQPALKDLRDRIEFKRVEATTLADIGPVYLLEGVWNKVTQERIAPDTPANDPKGRTHAQLWTDRDPRFLLIPRMCRVYLGRDPVWTWTSSLWPYRIEWHGMTRAGGGDELLATLEFTPRPRAGAEALEIFQLPEAEKKLAKVLDPTLVIKAWQERAAALKRMEQEMAKQKPLDSR
jgi:hypothetical protein